jgi:hypothetical protein
MMKPSGIHIRTSPTVKNYLSSSIAGILTNPDPLSLSVLAPKEEDCHVLPQGCQAPGCPGYARIGFVLVPLNAQWISDFSSRDSRHQLDTQAPSKIPNPAPCSRPRLTSPAPSNVPSPVQRPSHVQCPSAALVPSVHPALSINRPFVPLSCSPVCNNSLPSVPCLSSAHSSSYSFLFLHNKT